MADCYETGAQGYGVSHEIVEFNRVSNAAASTAYKAHSYWVCSCGVVGQLLKTGIPVLLKKDFRENHLRRLNED